MINSHTLNNILLYTAGDGGRIPLARFSFPERKLKLVLPLLGNILHTKTYGIARCFPVLNRYCQALYRSGKGEKEHSLMSKSQKEVRIFGPMERSYV